MSSDIAIKVENLSKCYQIYEQPRDRLKQFVMPRIQRGLGKAPKQYYREFWALKDVSFEVKKGETVGIIGRNGSGKSTLLQIICGTLNPTGGTVTTHGRIAALLELGSGFNPDFTGRENVYMNASVLGLSNDEINQRFDAIAAFADIGEFIEQPVKTYSSGMMVRLAFAVAINVEPDILVVDEALAVGDELFQRKCFSRIEDIRRAGSTILFVSHSGTQIVELCESAILIDRGEKIISGNPKGVVALYQRMLYAPPDMKSLLRSQMLSGLVAPAEDGSLKVDSKVVMDIQCLTIPGEREYYDSGLSPASVTEYISHGPVIENIKLFTKNSKPVNSLLRGERYHYRYRVKFNGEERLVRFGMSIKTTEGTHLAGAYSNSLGQDTINSIGAGSIVEVDFNFDCSLNPGLYFMNAGVFGEKNGGETFLHRIVDAVAFRVLPESDNLETEALFLKIKPEITIIQ